MDKETNPNKNRNDEVFTNIVSIRPSSAERARDLATLIKARARDKAAAALQKAEEAGVSPWSLLSTVRDQGPEAGAACQEERLKDKAEEVSNLIRRSPMLINLSKSEGLCPE